MMDNETYKDIKDFINNLFDEAMIPKEESDKEKVGIGYEMADLVKRAKGEEASLIYKAKVLEKTLKRTIEMLEEVS